MNRVLIPIAAWFALLAAGVSAKGALALVVVAVVVWWCRPRAAGRAAVGHSHGGSTATIARHEAGHVAAARAIGGGSVSVRAGRHGGFTTARGASKRATPAQWIGFSYAGQYAAGTSAGCSGDQDAIRRELRNVPRAERARVRREGQRLGRQWVSGARGQIRRDAATIERTGRL